LSGIKYSRASLSRAQKAFLLCKEKLQRNEDMCKALMVRVETFMLNHDRALHLTNTKLHALREKVKGITLDRVKADDSVYDHDLEAQTANFSRRIDHLEKIEKDIQTLEKDLVRLNRLTEEEKLQKANQQKLAETLSRAVPTTAASEANKSYLSAQKSELRELSLVLSDQLNGLTMVFDENPETFSLNLAVFADALRSLTHEIAQFIQATGQQLAQAEDVEAADATLKSLLRAKMHTQPPAAPNAERPERPWQDLLQNLQNHPARKLFREIDAHIAGIRQFAALSVEQQDYAKAKIDELVRQAENLVTKYQKLLNQSREYQADIAVAYGYFSDLRSLLNVDQKIRVDALAGEVKTFLSLEIAAESAYQNLIGKILRLREEFARSLENARENEFLANAIKETLAAAGYEIITEVHREYEESDAPRTFEIRLTERLRVKFSLAQSGDFIAQVIYRTNQTDLSNNEWEEIGYELQKWENNYDNMRTTLAKEGIEINAPDFKSFEQDRIIIEYMTDAEKEAATRIHVAQPKQRMAGSQ
jgi:hypothetical protein